MKVRITVFLLLGIACTLVHFHLLLFFSPNNGIPLAALRPPPSFAAVSLLWVLTLPSNFLMISSWVMSDPTYLRLLFIANSLLWGFCLGAVIFWLRLRYARRRTIH